MTNEPEAKLNTDVEEVEGYSNSKNPVEILRTVGMLSHELAGCFLLEPLLVNSNTVEKAAPAVVSADEE
jgi:hypothetical protein